MQKYPNCFFLFFHLDKFVFGPWFSRKKSNYISHAGLISLCKMWHIKQLCDGVAPLSLWWFVKVNISGPHEWHKGTSHGPQFQCVNAVNDLFAGYNEEQWKKLYVNMILHTNSPYCIASILKALNWWNWPITSRLCVCPSWFVCYIVLNLHCLALTIAVTQLLFPLSGETLDRTNRKSL